MFSDPCFYNKIEDYITTTKSRGDGVFEIQGRCSLRVITPVMNADAEWTFPVESKCFRKNSVRENSDKLLN